MMKSTHSNRRFGILLVAGLAVVAGLAILTVACTTRETSAVSKTPEAQQQVPAKPAVGTLYTCPMHPEVVQDHPGECPKCGMKLVAKTGAGADAAKKSKDASAEAAGPSCCMDK